PCPMPPPPRCTPSPCPTLFRSSAYVDLVVEARAAAVHLPVVAGIIPMTDPRRLARLAELTGVPVPAALVEQLTVAVDDDERHRRSEEHTSALQSRENLVCRLRL